MVMPIRCDLAHRLGRETRRPEFKGERCGSVPMPKVLYDKRGEIAYITLNRPDKRNAAP
jgi:hypothetical protein